MSAKVVIELTLCHDLVCKFQLHRFDTFCYFKDVSTAKHVSSKYVSFICILCLNIHHILDFKEMFFSKKEAKHVFYI